MQEPREDEREHYLRELAPSDALQTASQADSRQLLKGEELPETPDAVVYAGGVTFADAAQYGIDGRNVWAIANNRGPSPDENAVWKNANPPEWAEHNRRDSLAKTRESLRRLLRKGLIEEPIPGRYRLAVNSPVTVFSVRCSFCVTHAKPGRGKDEAISNAQAEGFILKGKFAFCPAHAAGRHLYPGGGELNPAYEETGGGGSVPVGGTFTLSGDGVASEPLPFNASEKDIENAVDGMRSKRVSKGAAERAKKAEKRRQPASGTNRPKAVELPIVEAPNARSSKCPECKGGPTQIDNPSRGGFYVCRCSKGHRWQVRTVLL
jgi:hypothetical protein